MKKIAVCIISMLCLGATFVAAQTANKVTNTRILQAAKDTTITYAGVKIFVPAGQTVVVGQTTGGNIILRGQNLQGVQVGEGTLSARGPVLLTVQPDTQVIRVVQGNNVQVKDGNGRVAEISAGAAVSAKDIRADVGSMLPATVVTVAAQEEVVAVPQQTAAKPVVVAEQVEEDDSFELPAFVAATSTSQAAAEQAVQNVEDTLSPSAPR